MCGCERCRPENPDPAYTEAHRIECLARSVLARPLDQRRSFLELFERNNGREMTRRLKEAIWRLWDEQRRATA
ncbi:MAG: hypothetical protein MZV65_31915 [Chromatiales bacterium]|nr:hypothetical protein [Chromatiales bacterium]